MNIIQHYWSALTQYAKSEAIEPPSRLVATPDVVHSLQREISLDGVHVIYVNGDKPVLRIE